MRKAWQYGNYPEKKFELIKPYLIENNVNSLLDIGCNAGEITRLIGNMGIFSVGIDKNIDLNGSKKPLNKACLGNIELDFNMANKLPSFDAITILSVHHQLIKIYGDKWVSDLFKILSKKTNILIVEFAARNIKYGKEPNELFIDNNQESITNYAFNWLDNIFDNCDVSYIGKSPTSDPKDEPFRFCFFVNFNNGGVDVG